MINGYVRFYWSGVEICRAFLLEWREDYEYAPRYHSISGMSPFDDERIGQELKFTYTNPVRMNILEAAVLGLDKDYFDILIGTGYNGIAWPREFVIKVQTRDVVVNIDRMTALDVEKDYRHLPGFRPLIKETVAAVEDNEIPGSSLVTMERITIDSARYTIKTRSFTICPVNGETEIGEEPWAIA